MKYKIILFISVLIIGANTVSMCRIKKLKEENYTLLENQKALLSQRDGAMAESQVYKIADSLNAAKISELQLTLREYKKFRAQDLKLIEHLKVKKSDLRKVISSQTETVSALSAKLQSFMNSEPDSLKHFVYTSKWTDVSGCIDLKCDSIDIQIKNRESLKIVETVKYKRFLGFLWRTKKVKSRHIDVVSSNPRTTIVNLDYVRVRP